MRQSLVALPLFVSLLMLASSCQDKSSGHSTSSNDNSTKTTVDSSELPPAPPKLPPPPARPPIINITDTIRPAMHVLVMKDSAANTDRIGLKMGEILSVKLAAFMKKAKVKPVGPPMAWFRSQKPPFFFEAGIPVDKKPAKLDKGISIKSLGKDSVIIAHFYGPYELTYQAYEAVEEILQSRKRKLKGDPVEIYVDDPIDANGKPKDPYKVLTDIVFPFR